MADETDPQSALVPVRTQTVDFYGDTLPAAQLADGEILVPVRPIVEALGLAWAAQRLRLNRDPVLHDAQGVIVMITPGGPQEMTTLPLKFLPGFLFGLNASRVKPELRERIVRYQRECYDVLWNAFKGDVVPAAPAPRDLSPVEQALLLAEAVAGMAREHLALEQRVTTIADYTRGYIQQSRRQIADHEDRLTALELHFGSTTTISEAQAAEIQMAVKNVAMRLIAQGQPNGFAQVWGDLYRRFQVGAYRNLPAARYTEALDWLQGWYRELESSGS